ncbi:PKD domain-containing protein [Aquimarina sp. LLG6339-5]|uniref:PKD domain-containing protein n=1 Tax=Aquimarina sp. LLG6339-5 TaxID=3160830 RepID=UPI0038655411
MSTKLSTITTQYRRFTKNQVLTEGHLNEIVDFFDDQDRLSRICLSGVGIVCGFKVSCDEVNSTISISQGAGVTTDGDLFHLYQIDQVEGTKIMDIEAKEYTHYKVYNNEKANYTPFFYDGDTQLEIFELLTAEQAEIENDDHFVLSALQGNTGLAIKEGVVLLYLEQYEKELDLCVSLSCDNQGQEMIGNYKALLVSKTVAEQINDDDPIISKTNFSNLFHQLPDVSANRVVCQPEDFIHYQELKRSFTNSLYQNNVVGDLRFGFQTLLTAMQMPILLGAIEDNLEALYSFPENDVPPDFQYRYDLLKDVIDTYIEIKEVLFNMDCTSCCPDIMSFPKHLMLGEVEKTEPCYEYRHGFYKSPLLTDQNVSTCSDCLTADGLEQPGNDATLTEFIIDLERNEIDVCYGENSDEQRLHSLIKRAVQLLANYNVNYTFIEITPSFELGKLSKKAIPFYNNVGDHLIQLWDYDKTVLGKHRNNLGYHRDLLNIKRPLEICIDHDFYRIEGHQGRNYTDALERIQDIRREHGLGFNVVVLKINESDAQDFVENYTTFYLNKNHGFEHKGGVAPGGTFVMVYVEGEFRSYPYPYGYGYPYPYPGPSLAGDFEGEVDEEGIEVLNPVIADFTLPYMCCDENFITLSLPTRELCFDETTEPLPFHITPTGGYVEAQVPTGLNGGVTINQFGEFVFDPNLVSDELIGETITFTVNNFTTECEIVITKRPEFGIAVDSISEPTEDNQVTVTFNIIGDNLEENLEYTWDFGDGSDRVESTETSIEHAYRFETSGVFTFTVIAQGGVNACANREEIEVTIEIVEEIVVEIEPSTICRGDDVFYPFTIQPDGAQVTITGDGVSFRNDRFVFRATDVPSSISSVPISVNGEASGIVITIEEQPSAQFTHLIEENTLVLNNTSDIADRYLWNVAGEEIERTNRSQVRRSLDLYDASSIIVSLSAISDLCGERLDGPRSIIIGSDEGEFTCVDIVSGFVRGMITEFETIRNSGALEGFGEETILAFDSIEERFNAVIQDVESFTSGDNNNLLFDMFDENTYRALFEGVRGARAEEELSMLRVLIEVYTQLFYNILRCQSPALLQESIEQISSITNLINTTFEEFRQLEFNPDIDGTLKEFLENIKETFQDSTFLISQIDQQLVTLGADERG